MADLSFDNLVAVITGAGGGLGKDYALEFGRRGAKVVVNDLGSSSLGEGNNSQAADLVVQEIIQNGGQAVANYDSVENGERIIKTAIDAYGKIDILINNAGILRDKSINRMEEQDWDLIMKVHLRGTFTCTKAAWPHMRKNNFGRIINLSSGAGLYGNFGQGNYSAAKLGLVGFTKSLARECGRFNIRTNVLAPIGVTRMTADILPEDLHKILTVQNITPMVIYLSHPSCDLNGRIFELGGGWFSEVRHQRSQGVYANQVTPDILLSNFEKVQDFSNSDYPGAISDTFTRLNVIARQLAQNKTGGTDLNSKRVLGLIKSYFDSGAVLPVKDKITFHIEITDSSGVDSYTLAVNNGQGSLIKGKPDKSDVSFKLKEDVFIKLCTGALKPQMAFLQGKISMSGSLAKATKFSPEMFPPLTEESFSKYPPSRL